MTDNSRLISLKVQAEDGTASSAEAVSIGLIVAELVINAFKHAFVGDEAAGLVVVAYEVAETSWKLTVSDNGIGTPEGQLDLDKPRPGLGTIIVAALAKQLDARVEVIRNRVGTTVSITHGISDRAGLCHGSSEAYRCRRQTFRTFCQQHELEAGKLAAPGFDLAPVKSLARDESSCSTNGHSGFDRIGPKRREQRRENTPMLERAKRRHIQLRTAAKQAIRNPTK